jgi:hypothetical protein
MPCVRCLFIGTVHFFLKEEGGVRKQGLVQLKAKDHTEPDRSVAGCPKGNHYLIAATVEQ